MIYFFINLMIHLSVSGIFLFFLIRTAEANAGRKNKRGISFLLPFLFSVFFLLHGLWNTFPKAADSVAIVKQSYQPIVEGSVEEIGFINNTLKINGVVYFYNPFAYKPNVGDTIRISTTEYSRYIANLSVVEKK